ncbi:MAG TPA: histidinol-phosphatase [Opitutaceae bacterium]|nr:histidinol-phosphatase [Opitutaceae bacterium]
MISEELRKFALELAQASGELIRPHFSRGDLTVELKADRTIVTKADRDAERLMREMIDRRYPGHGILGEEFGTENANAEYVWVLDPIDGTVSFASGVPLFGTLIALCHHGEPVLGIIHQPILGELMVGDGTVTTLNDRRVHTRPTTRVEDSVLLCTDPKNVALHHDADRFYSLLSRTTTPRGWGDCYGYLMIASGRADIMCDPILNPWDIAALVPVIRGAGGVITDWEGRPPMNAHSIVAASTPELHSAVIAALNSGPAD